MIKLTLSNSDARKLKSLLRNERDNALNRVDKNIPLGQCYQRMLNSFSSKFK